MRIEVDPTFNTTATRLPLWDYTCLGADRIALRAAARFLRRLAREGGGGGRVKEQRRQQRVVFQLRGASEWGEGGFDEGGEGAAYYEQYYKVAYHGDRDNIEEAPPDHRGCARVAPRCLGHDRLVGQHRQFRAHEDVGEARHLAKFGLGCGARLERLTGGRGA